MLPTSSKDPLESYTLEDLLKIGYPTPPPDFEAFWQKRYDRARRCPLAGSWRSTSETLGEWRIAEFQFTSTANANISGWILLPIARSPRCGIVVTHGYGGRAEPDLSLPLEDAILIFPRLRGFNPHETPGGVVDPYAHVVSGIDRPEDYLIGACVEDIWMTVSYLEHWFPEIEGRIGYLGGSFGGGVGLLALPWEARIQRAALVVPTFGNHPLREQFATVGSGQALLSICRARPDLRTRVLPYFDAANAAQFLQTPILCACAQQDPAVTPVGQFSAFNAIAGPKELFPYATGHIESPAHEREQETFTKRLITFFNFSETIPEKPLPPSPEKADGES